MENVSIEEGTVWRKYMTDRLLYASQIKVLDPYRRIHNGIPKEFKRVFELDLLDIRNADIIIANLCNPQLAKHGTAMEIFYANYILRKPVIAFKDDPTVKHPFFEQLVTSWVSTPTEAIDMLLNEYT